MDTVTFKFQHLLTNVQQTGLITTTFPVRKRLQVRMSCSVTTK